MTSWKKGHSKQRISGTHNHLQILSKSSHSPSTSLIKAKPVSATIITAPNIGPLHVSSASPSRNLIDSRFNRGLHMLLLSGGPAANGI